MQQEYDIIATVHMPVGKGGYRVKIDIPGIGLYLNGAVVFPNNRDSDEPWVMFPPSYSIGRGENRTTFYPAEFDRSMPLWQEMSEAAFLAVEEYI